MTGRPRIAVVALGASNHATMCNALTRAGAQPVACRSADELDGADAVVIPGVANVAFLIDSIDANALRAPLLDAISRGLPALGVCAGFQVCFEACDEAPNRTTLGLFSGRVRAMDAPKLPHMGWNRVESTVPAFTSGWAYFAHSFAAPPGGAATIAVTRHGAVFASASRRDNVLGLQFHPERSGAFGAAILRAFVEDAGRRC
jgi:imidazole glycerol-phosphate synthase subunit HisH